jgi:hypothetical protein
LKYGSVPVDLTGATAAAAALPRTGPVVLLTATILDATAGEVQIGIDPAEGLPSDSYTYDLEIRQGAVVTTWVRGSLTVTADITNALVVD